MTMQRSHPEAVLKGPTRRFTIHHTVLPFRPPEAPLDHTEEREWRKHRNCNDVPTRVFYEDVETAARFRNGRVNSEAFKLCSACPVSGHCLEDALRQDAAVPSEGGMQAGTTYKDRTALLYTLHRENLLGAVRHVPLQFLPEDGRRAQAGNDSCGLTQKTARRLMDNFTVFPETGLSSRWGLSRAGRYYIRSLGMAPVLLDDPRREAILRFYAAHVRIIAYDPADVVPVQMTPSSLISSLRAQVRRLPPAGHPAYDAIGGTPPNSINELITLYVEFNNPATLSPALLNLSSTPEIIERYSVKPSIHAIPGRIAKPQYSATALLANAPKLILQGPFSA